MSDSPGKRLYSIRLACGDGVRTAETLKLFSDRIRVATGVVYHPNALSLLERDEQNWRIEDARLLSQVDPQQRGAVWLAFGVKQGRGKAVIPEGGKAAKRASGQ